MNILESSSNVTIYALDENSVSVELDNRSSWSFAGVTHILEKNACHEGINVVGSTSILNNSHTVNDVYPNKYSITSLGLKCHLEHLIKFNSNKKVVEFLDNARTHTSKLMQEFCQEKMKY